MSKTRKTPETPTLYRAETDTRHFTWEAYGRTADEARKVLTRTLREHTEHTRSEVATYVDSATVYEVRAGVGMRDYSVVTR